MNARATPQPHLRSEFYFNPKKTDAESEEFFKARAETMGWIVFTKRPKIAAELVTSSATTANVSSVAF